MLDAAHALVLGEGGEGAGPPPSPFRGAFLGADEILPQLDQRVGQAAGGGVLVERIALEAAIIRLVVADDKGRVAAEMVDHRLGDARILIPQKGNLPWPPLPSPDRRE